MPMDDEEQGNKVTNANDPQAKIVLIVVPVITVFTAITIGMIPILSIILGKRFKIPSIEWNSIHFFICFHSN